MKKNFIDRLGQQITSFGNRRKNQKKNEITHRTTLFEEVIDNMLDLVAISDLEGNFIYAGKSHYRLGYSISFLIGKNVMDFVHPEDIPRVRYNFSQFFQGKATHTAVYRYRCSDGSYIWLETRAKFLTDKNGSATQILFNTREVTKRKHWEESLKNERRRLGAIIEGTNVGTWEWNVQTGETVFNERWASMIGYSLNELSPTSIDTWRRFTHVEDVQRSEQLLKAHFQGAMPFYENEIRLRHRDGHWVWILDRGKVATKTADGHPEWVYGTHQDITARKELEERHLMLASAASFLQASSAESINYSYITEVARNLSGAAFAALNIIDQDHTYFTTKALSGEEKEIKLVEELVGFPLTERKWSYDATRESALKNERIIMFSSLMELTSSSFPVSLANKVTNAFSLGEVALVRIDKAKSILGDFVLLFSQEEHIQSLDLVETYASMVGITLDRIATEHINNRLIKEKELLLKEVHHRIKNNMNTMTSLLAMHAAQLKDSVASYAITDATSRLRSMQVLYDQLYLSENCKQSPVLVYLRALVRQVVDLFPRSEEILVQVKSLSPDCEVGLREVCDGTKELECTLDTKRLTVLGLIVNELITNIMKYAFPYFPYSDQSRKESPKILVTLGCVGKEISITLEDNGIGLPLGFDQNMSTGFGLTMVRAMVEQLEGNIWFEKLDNKQTEEKGTRVVLQFPADDQKNF